VLQSLQPRRREDDGVELAVIEFPQPRIEIAADRCEVSARKQPRELCAAANAARPDAWRASERTHDVFDAAPDGGSASASRIGRITASRASSRGSTAPISSPRAARQACPCCCERPVDVALEQRVLDFLHEQPLAADLRQFRLGQTVAGVLMMTT
jgi:hypothetical protein